MYIVKILYSLVIPPGGIITLLIIFNICLYRQKHRLAYVLSFIIAIFYLLSTQFVAYQLIKPLENMYANYSLIELKAQNPDVIVMLGGGAINNVEDIDGDGQVSGYVANRMLTVMRLQKALDVPVILAGGKVFADTGREADIEQRIFTQLGVSPDKLLIENQSRNTVENAQNSKQIMEAHHFTKPILVTSGFHMPRSMMIFERENLTPIAYTTDYQMSGKIAFSIFNLLPNNGALNNSCMAIREYLGILALKLHLQ